jgi:hypothetical protein
VCGGTSLAISWREVLALLVGLALCYTVFSYALTMVSENREAASEQPQEEETSLLGSSAQQSATTTPEGETMKTLTIRVKGPDSGIHKY